MEMRPAKSRMPDVLLGFYNLANYDGHLRSPASGADQDFVSEVGAVELQELRHEGMPAHHCVR